MVYGFSKTFTLNILDIIPSFSYYCELQLASSKTQKYFVYKFMHMTSDLMCANYLKISIYIL